MCKHISFNVPFVCEHSILDCLSSFLLLEQEQPLFGSGTFCTHFHNVSSERLAAQPTWVGGHGMGDGSCLNDHRANVHML